MTGIIQQAMQTTSLSQEHSNMLLERSVKDPDFRKRLIEDPKGTIEQEFGISLPANLQVSVKEEKPDLVYLVLPGAGIEPDAEELLPEELDRVAGGGPTYGCVTGAYDCITRQPENCK